MRHDMDTAHGGTTGACNKNAGIMSYQEANKTKKPWSTCSNFDLKVWYNTILAMNMTWCMEGKCYYFFLISIYVAIYIPHILIICNIYLFS